MFKTITIISLALAGAGLAQPELVSTDRGEHAGRPHERREHRREAIRERIHDRFDADADGQLSESEREAAREAMRQRREAHRARVLDGIQSRSLGELPEPIALALGEFDLDKNLSIDDDERVLLELEIDARLEAKKAEMLANYDTDADGRLSKDERASAREARRAEHEQRRAEMLAKFDTDADGRLSRDEREAMRAAEGGPARDPLLELLRPRRGPGAHSRRAGRGPDAARGPRAPRGPRPLD